MLGFVDFESRIAKTHVLHARLPGFGFQRHLPCPRHKEDQMRPSGFGHIVTGAYFAHA